MALKVWDGFDHYNQEADFNSRSGFLQWNITTAPNFITGRNGNGLALQTQFLGGNTLTGTMGQRVAAAFIGIAANAASGAGMVYTFGDSVAGSPQISVAFDPTNFTVGIYRGNSPLTSPTGTLLYLSANNVWAANVYNFIEIFPTINGSTGSVVVNINGVTVASISGANTQNTANAWWDTLAIRTYNNVSLALDDFYYADTTTGPGTYPCDNFLGDSRVATLFATGNDAVQWTPLTSTNWVEVSEVAMDSDTSYNSTATPGDQDTYTFGALSGTITTIYGVQITTAQRKDDASPRTTKSVLKISSTDYYGTTNSLPTSTYAYFTDLWILDPATSANWTVSDVNAATYGIQCVS